MEGVGDGGSRRRQFHADERSDSANLRDFLRVKEDDDGRNLAGLTLSAVLGCENRPAQLQATRSLHDIIRDDPYGGKDSKKSWKAFKEKLRLRRNGSCSGASWTSTVSTPASDVPIQNANRMISRRNSTRFGDQTHHHHHHQELSSLNSINGGENHVELNSMPSNRAMMLRRNSSRIPSRTTSRYGGSTSFNNAGEVAELHRRLPSGEEEEEEEGGEEGEEEEEEEEVAEEDGGEQPVRMSLMALLAETDREMGLDGANYMSDDEEEEEEVIVGGEYNNCCVCMVRHKGAAFIPCGHTFCRLCSRELWVQRGNCPLCNGFILEILDIF
ncbi:unnamed protein product [Camellia sinensis]